VGRNSSVGTVTRHRLHQRFPNFFQVGTTFISQNVLRTTLFLPPLKANCSRFSTTVCDTHFTFILFFLSFFGLMFNLRGPQGQNPRTTCGPRTTVWETLGYTVQGSNPAGGEIFRAHPVRPWGPPSRIYIFPGGKVAGAWHRPSTPIWCRDSKRVDLYHYCPSGPLWPVLGWTLLYFTFSLEYSILLHIIILNIKREENVSLSQLCVCVINFFEIYIYRYLW
jgi:hypothetical protein